MASSEKECYDESATDAEYSDDSEKDPNFDVLEVTRLTFSNLSLKRKPKRLKSCVKDGKEGELDDQEQNSYEAILKIIQCGHLDRLKVDECKLYLRKHGLRLSGKKGILIQRIKEHIDIVNGGGEKKYPASSFVLNCKGDACTGDVVMFEQNVYEQFSIASRSAKGGPCGTRVVAGRILKESYGAAKQQHTFTIEVLWSKGEKPLHPLHPLLIKGRNLYRLKTMRQKWEDESKRQKILLEKHVRGGAARLKRVARSQKERWKLQKQTRATRNEHLNAKQEVEKREHMHSIHVKPDKLNKQAKQQEQQPNVHNYTTTTKSKSNIPSLPLNLLGKLDYTSNAHVLPVHQRQPLDSMNCCFQKGHPTGSQFSNFYSSESPTWARYNEHENYFTGRGAIGGHPWGVFSSSNDFAIALQRHALKENQEYSSIRIPSCGFGPEQSRVQNLNGATNRPVQQQKVNKQKQKCRYFVQGRCHFGDRCKYLHE